MIDEVAERIYTVLTKRVSASNNDPDMTFIVNTLKEIPENKVEAFYHSLVAEKTNFNRNGFMSHYHITEAMKKFKKELLQELWHKHGLSYKVAELKEKIEGLAFNLSSKSAQEILEYCKKVDIERLYIITKRGNLFTPKELEILEHRSLGSMIISCRKQEKDLYFSDISYSLWEKIESLAKVLASHSDDIIMQYCKENSAEKFQVKEQKQKLFNQEEVTVILQKGLWNMLKALQYDSVEGLHNIIENEYKTYITKEYLTVPRQPQLSAGGRRVVSLLANLVEE